MKNGGKLSIETRMKISLTKRGHSVSEETRKKISDALKGRKMLPQTRQGLLNAINGNTFTRGKTWKVKTQKPFGPAHHRWIADRNKLKKYTGSNERRSARYKTWRNHVWFRDKYKCKMKNKDCVGRIEAHHILPWAKFENLRYEENNGITLCHFHHPRRRADESRLAPFFQELLVNEP